MNAPAPVDVLLVEDDPADVFMIEEAMAAWRVPTRLHVASDGEQGTDFLRQRGNYVDAPRPAFVLLDLNMPRKNGFEVLTEIKGDQELSVIPIVVFTTSSAQEDVVRSYRARANAYVVKPSNYDDYEQAIRSIDEFYTRICTRPPITPRAG